MHSQVSKDVATLRARSPNASAFERDPWNFFGIEKFGTAQMIVAFLDSRVDAPYLDLGSDRRILRTFPVNFDPAAEVGELATSRAEELMHAESNRRAGLIELVVFLC
jgi:hypothetical protein